MRVLVLFGFLAGIIFIGNSAVLAQGSADISAYSAQAQSLITRNVNFKPGKAVPVEPLKTNGRLVSVKSLKRADEGAVPPPSLNLSQAWVSAAVEDDTENDGSAGAPFKTIQKAIDNCANGAVIHVGAGTYTGTINIEGKSGLSLIGSGDVTVAPASVISFGVSGLEGRSTVVRVVNSENVIIENIVFNFNPVSSSAYCGVLFWNSSATVRNCQLLNMSGGTATAYLRSVAETKVVNITGTKVLNPGRIGVLAHGNIQANITNSEIIQYQSTAGFGIEIGSQASAVISGNTIRGFRTAPSGESVAGIYLENAYTSGVSGNKYISIANNHINGCQYGIYIGNEWDGLGGAVGINAGISNNDLTSNLLAGILITDEDKSRGSRVNVSTSNNTVVGNSNYGYFIYTNGDGDISLNATGDRFANAVVAVAVKDETTTPGASGATSSIYRLNFNLCSIEGLVGIINEQDDVVIARNNWWGDISGPAHRDNLKGMGSAVSNRVIYAPWVSSSTPATANFDGDSLIDANDPDDDNDGFSDIEEIANKTSPFDAADIPQKKWEFTADSEGWLAVKSLSDFSVANGVLSTTVTGEDPNMLTPVSVSATAYKYLQIRYRVSGYSDTAELLWAGTGGNGMYSFKINPDGLFHVYTIDLSALPNWAGQITTLRFDPTTANTGAVGIDYIRFVSVPELPNVWNFNTAGNAEGWLAAKSLSAFDVSAGTLKSTITGIDPYMTIGVTSGVGKDVNFDADSYKGVRLKMKVAKGSAASLFWISKGKPMAGISFNISSGTGMQTYNLDLSNNPDWTGKITYLRLDPVDTAADGNIEIDSIEVLDSISAPATEFSTAGNTEGWKAGDSASLSDISVSNGALKAAITGKSPFLTNSLFNFSAAQFPYVQMRIKATAGTQGQLYWATKNAAGVIADGFKTFNITADGLFHVYALNLTGLANWANQVAVINFVPAYAETGSVEVDYIRFMTAPDAAPAWNFETAGNAEGWQAAKSLSAFNVSGGTLKSTITNEDPYMTIGSAQQRSRYLYLDADSYKGVRLKMKATSGTTARLFWVSQGGTAMPGELFNIIPGAMTTYNINLRNNPGWAGRITYLRLDPVDNASSGDIEIDSIEVIDTTPVPVFEFNTVGDTEGWQAGKNLLPLTVSDGALKTSVTGADSYMVNPLVSFKADTFPYVQIRMKTTADSPVAQLYWLSNETGANRKNFRVFQDGLFHTYNIDLKGIGNWKGQIRQLRLYPTIAKSGDIEVDYIRLSAVSLAPAPISYEFNDNSDEGWTPWKDLSSFEVKEDGKLYTSPTGKDPSMRSMPGLPIDASVYKTIEIRYAVVGNHIGRAQLYWARSGENFSGDRGVAFNIAADSEFHTYTIDVGSNPNWAGQVELLRFDPVAIVGPDDASDMQIIIDYIRGY